MELRTVTLTEANQQFAAIIRGVEDEGHVVVITRQGTPIARLVPEPATEDTDPGWTAARDRMFAILRKGYALHVAAKGRLSRDEMHER